MPKVRAGAETIDKEQLRREIERSVEMEYPVKPSWIDSPGEIRDRNVLIEYNRLTKLRGYSCGRARQILASLIGRGEKTIQRLLS